MLERKNTLFTMVEVEKVEVYYKEEGGSRLSFFTALPVCLGIVNANRGAAVFLLHAT